MIRLVDTDDFACVLGCDWFRWYVGLSYEKQHPDVRAVVVRLGPLFMHLITRR